MHRDTWLRIGLFALALVPIPLFWLLGERSLRALETADLRLRGRQAEVELLTGLRDAARAALRVAELVLPLDDDARTGVRDTPDGAFLAHPVLLRAREERDLVAALETLDPLLVGTAGPEAAAAARVLAAARLEEVGDHERGRRMRATAAALVERMSRPAVARWVAFESGAAKTPFDEWYDVVFRRATDLEELVLLRRLAAATADADERVARLDDRARWPERLGAVRERLRALGADGLAVLATTDGWNVVADGQLTRFPSFPAWLESARIAGATARLGALDEEAGEFDRVVSGVVGADGLLVDLGKWSVVLELPAPRLFGVRSPRVLLAAAIAAWGVLAILLVGAVLRQERRARELVAAREDLIAQVAHELRTPLTVLRLYGESLLEGRVPTTRRSEYLRTIAAEATRLGALVDRVARAARQETEESVRDTATCDAAGVVRRVASPFGAAAEDAGGALEVDPLPGVAPAAIEEDELRLVLDVLLENALRHGGAPPRVHVGMDLEDGVVRCLIEDEGEGLDAEDAADPERLFERWTRGRRAKRGGAGMGLFLARRATRARGGDVALERGASGGVRAVVTLAAAPESEELGT